MDEVIKETYEAMLKVQEREIDNIKNRMEFANWLFGVASTLIITSIVAARTIVSDGHIIIAEEKFISLSVGIFAFISIVLTFIGKWQGYASINNRSIILTLLDIQKFAFLKENPPEDKADKKFLKFSGYKYLPKEHFDRYKLHESYGKRKFSEVLWLYLNSASVFLSLGSLLLLLVELCI